MLSLYDHVTILLKILRIEDLDLKMNFEVLNNSEILFFINLPQPLK